VKARVPIARFLQFLNRQLEGSYSARSCSENRGGTVPAGNRGNCRKLTASLDASNPQPSGKQHFLPIGNPLCVKLKDHPEISLRLHRSLTVVTEEGGEARRSLRLRCTWYPERLWRQVVLHQGH
jgi:hypothetical protein